MAKSLIQLHHNGASFEVREENGEAVIYLDGVAAGVIPATPGATITDPTGGSTIDAEARTAINAIIDRLQAAGIIA